MRAPSSSARGAEVRAHGAQERAPDAEQRALVAPVRALIGRALRDARTRTLVFAYVFAFYAYVQPVGYRGAYPTLAERLSFARSFAGNDALRLFYGFPYRVETVDGYTAWRVGGTLAIAAAVFGVLAAVRALRTEEDAGRAELVLASPVSRGTSFLASVTAIVAGTALLWAAQLAGFLAGGLPAGGGAFLALTSTSVVFVYAGIGALACQLAPTRRVALELGSAAVGAGLIVRVIADTASGAGWLRWGSPLGWAELMRPFSHPRPLVLALPVCAGCALLALSARISRRRDVGVGLWRAHDEAEPRMRLLGSPAAQALRGELPSLLVWAASASAFALVLGVVSASISSANLSPSIRRELARLGSGSLATPTGYLAFVFVFFALALSLFACAQVAAMRREESEGRLETLLGGPLSRPGWLLGRLAPAAAGAVVISVLAGLGAWLGALIGHVPVSLGEMLGAGANCLPVALLFMAIAALLFAVLPRAASAISYSLVSVGYLWLLVGSLLQAPSWLIDLTPFRHIAAVPSQAFRAGDAAAMVGIALVVTAVACVAFRARDLTGE